MSNCCKLLNVHGVKYVRYIKIRTAEPPVPRARVFEFEMAIEILKRCKSPAIGQIPAELIKGGSRKIRPDLLVLFTRRNCLRREGTNSYTYLYKVIKETLVITGAYYFYYVHKIFILHSSLKDNSMYRENYWDYQCGFRRNRSITDLYSAFFKYLRKNWSTKSQCITYL